MLATNGSIDYLQSKGIANRQSLTSINTKSKFKIASITKTFTAVMILQLYEAGKLKLDATIGTYFPAYRGEGKNTITLRHLLTYSSGLPNCEATDSTAIYRQPINTDDFILKYCSGRLLSRPGSTFSYNNGDYVLLGKIIELITGKTYNENLSERILVPLGLANTGMLQSTDILTGLVESYTYNNKAKAYSSDEPYYIENFFAAGAMYSTVEDLLKFDNGIFGFQLLKKPTVALMTKPDTALGNVALGFWSADQYGPLNTRFVYRPGGIFGSTANWIHVPGTKKSIIVFSNTNATNLFEMSQQLYAVATGQKTSFLPAPSRSAPAKGGTDLSRLLGTWSIDLRPAPNSEPYLKEFVIDSLKGITFSGVFYGSAFSNGLFTNAWDYPYFGFTTTDQTNTYYHSGYIDGNKVYGISYSDNRRFISHWSGTKK